MDRENRPAAKALSRDVDQSHVTASGLAKEKAPPHSRGAPFYSVNSMEFSHADDGEGRFVLGGKDTD